MGRVNGDGRGESNGLRRRRNEVAAQGITRLDPGRAEAGWWTAPSLRGVGGIVFGGLHWVIRGGKRIPLERRGCASTRSFFLVGGGGQVLLQNERFSEEGLPRFADKG